MLSARRCAWMLASFAALACAAGAQDQPIPSGIDRKAFNVWKSQYWKNRALDFSSNP